jgi:hypothetical protein
MSRIRPEHLRGFDGLREVAKLEIVARQPTSVLELLAMKYVGRKTARRLLEAGLVADPHGAMRPMCSEQLEEFYRLLSEQRRRYGRE